MKKTDVIIIGAGAAGLMCGIEAGKRQRKVMVFDQSNKPGKKILMSGGGRCNFTNYYITPENFISHNPHFCKSALARYTQWDFINLVKKYRIPFHEKTQGQLFCDDKSKAILDLLLSECEKVGVDIYLNSTIQNITKLNDYHFKIKTSEGYFECESLVIASGGLSIPTMGASPFGYKVAEQFGIKRFPTRAGLVPLTMHEEDKSRLSILTGIAVDTIVSNEKIHFRENSLFTHRGLSGPAILQISSYWNPGEAITINLLPEINIIEKLMAHRKENPNKQLKNSLIEYLPKRVVDVFLNETLAEKKLNTLSQKDYQEINALLHEWKIIPNGTEGYRTAEVTLGGVDCDAISSKTMEAHSTPGLYFIGEVLDVSGWLGGFNFQWAWSSGWAAGQVV